MKIKPAVDVIYDLIKAKSSPTSLIWLEKQLYFSKKEIKTALQSLLRDGKIVRSRAKCFSLPKTASKTSKEPLLTGKVNVHPDGYAFFTPESGGVDLFVAAAKLGGAFDGDKVRVRKTRYRGRIEGHVVEILERGLSKIVGRIERRGNSFKVIPIHRKFTTPIVVPQGEYAQDDIVVCKIERFGEGGSYCSGSVLEKLGNITDKGIENIIVMAKYNLSVSFPPEVDEDAKKAAKDLPLPGNNNERFDLRDLFTVTIDGETARDFDDAISVIKTDSGYTLYVHIADVSHYVQPGNALDLEAYKRGTSIYFPEFAIPMLPEILSNGVCSLNPNEDKFTLTVKINYSSLGERKDKHVYQSVIRSDRRLTYKFVNQLLAGEATDAVQLTEMLLDARELTESIKLRRKAQGMLDIDLPEVWFDMDQDGNILNIMPAERGVSERIIEHFMIEANEAVAETLEQIASVSLFRVHASPDPLKISEWVKLAREFGYDAGEAPAKVTPDIVQKWLAELENKKYGYIIRSLLVRSLQRAEYSPENVGHFGLASESYTHFTSPIRRYPDLIVHRLLKKYLFHAKYTLDDEYMEGAAAHTSFAERNADDAEREIELYKKFAYLQKHAGEIYSAYVNKVSTTHISIFLTQLLMFGMIDNATLPVKGYKSGKSKYFAGDELKVMWANNDYDRLEATFIIEEAGERNHISRAVNKDTKSRKKASNKHYKKLAKKKRKH